MSKAKIEDVDFPASSREAFKRERGWVRWKELEPGAAR